jgi:hypothetical protein
MKATIQLTRGISVDDYDVLAQSLHNGKGLELSVFDCTEDAENPELDLCIEHSNHEIPATLWVTLGKQEAIFFAKSILALAESI